MPARRGLSSRTEGRHPKVPRERTRGAGQACRPIDREAGPDLLARHRGHIDDVSGMIDVNSKGVLYGIAAAPPCMHSRMLLFIILTPARQLLRYSNGLYPGFLYNLLELLRMSGL